MTIYISVVLLLLFINYTLYIHQDIFSSPQELCRSIYFQFLAFQIIILWIWGGISSASAVKEEITGKTYDFFRMLPLAAHQKTTGILIGKNLVVLFLTAINCLFLISFGSAGGLSVNLQSQIFLGLFSIAILINSTALLSSINPNLKSKKTNALGIVILVFLFGPFLFGSLGALSEIAKLEEVTAWFFVIELPFLILISLTALYFCCWAVIGILRKFTREDEPLFTRKGALLFMLGFEFILLGLFYYYLEKGETTVSYTYWMLSLLAVLAIPFGALRSFEKYIEYSGLIRAKSGSNVNAISHILLHSNISLVLGLSAIWYAGSIAIILISRMEFLQGLYRIMILFSYYIFLMLLLELNVLYKPLSRKIGHLLIFIAGVYAILPPILSAIFESDTLYLHSPFGFFWAIIEEPYKSMPSLTSVWVVNLLLCVVPILLIWKRYSYILKLRQKM
jgi:hypothetical protein